MTEIPAHLRNAVAARAKAATTSGEALANFAAELVKAADLIKRTTAAGERAKAHGYTTLQDYLEALEEAIARDGWHLALDDDGPCLMPKDQSPTRRRGSHLELLHDGELWTAPVGTPIPARGEKPGAGWTYIGRAGADLQGL